MSAAAAARNQENTECGLTHRINFFLVAGERRTVAVPNPDLVPVVKVWFGQIAHASSTSVYMEPRHV
jgi:hypothetical protein